MSDERFKKLEEFEVVNQLKKITLSCFTWTWISTCHTHSEILTPILAYMELLNII